MQINLRVQFEDESSKDLTAKAVDIVAFEERYDLSVARLENQMKMTHLFFLAWHVDQRTGGTKETFEKWLEAVDAVEVFEPKK
jgi:hypothetical protein